MLPLVNTRVIMALDRVDALWGLPFKDDCFGMCARGPRTRGWRSCASSSASRPRRRAHRPPDAVAVQPHAADRARRLHARSSSSSPSSTRSRGPTRTSRPSPTDRRAPLPRAPRDAPANSRAAARSTSCSTRGTSLFDDLPAALRPAPAQRARAAGRHPPPRQRDAVRNSTRRSRRASRPPPRRRGEGRLLPPALPPLRASAAMNTPDDDDDDEIIPGMLRMPAMPAAPGLASKPAASNHPAHPPRRHRAAHPPRSANRARPAGQHAEPDELRERGPGRTVHDHTASRAVR